MESGAARGQYEARRERVWARGAGGRGVAGGRVATARAPAQGPARTFAVAGVEAPQLHPAHRVLGVQLERPGEAGSGRRGIKVIQGRPADVTSPRQSGEWGASTVAPPGAPWPLSPASCRPPAEAILCRSGVGRDRAQLPPQPRLCRRQPQAAPHQPLRARGGRRGASLGRGRALAAAAVAARRGLLPQQARLPVAAACQVSPQQARRRLQVQRPQICSPRGAHRDQLGAQPARRRRRRARRVAGSLARGRRRRRPAGRDGRVLTQHVSEQLPGGDHVPAAPAARARARAMRRLPELLSRRARRAHARVQPRRGEQRLRQPQLRRGEAGLKLERGPVPVC
jgi:hypothetical protein